MELKITEQNFEEEVVKSNIPVLVDFYADWCGPCKMMAPVVAELAAEYEGKCKVGKCNVDENMNLAQKYGVMSIPNMIVFKSGEVKANVVGAVSKTDLADIIDSVLLKVQKCEENIKILCQILESLRVRCYNHPRL